MRYTDSHEWVSLDGKIGTVGITDYAQKELGEIVYIDLPKEGQVVKRGDVVCVLESTKAAVDVYAPLSGKIIQINQELKQKLPVSQGAIEWLFKIECSQLNEWDDLLDCAPST